MHFFKIKLQESGEAAAAVLARVARVSMHFFKIKLQELGEAAAAVVARVSMHFLR